MMAIVILSYNHPGITSKCVESALAFGKAFQNKIYLVHNGSVSKNESHLREQFSLPLVTHLSLKENLGFTGGANFGLRRAFDDGAEFVLFMSNDTVLKNLSENLLANLQGLSSGFLIAPRVERRSTGLVDSLGATVDLRRGHLAHRRDDDLGDSGVAPQGYFQKLTDSAVRPYVPGAAFIIDKTAWRKTGGFDETLGTYWEDVDLSLRALKLGLGLYSCPELILTHGIAKTCVEPIYTVYFYHRNRRRIVFRYGGLLDKVWFSALEVAGVVKKSFRFIMRRDWMRLKLLLKR